VARSATNGGQSSPSSPETGLLWDERLAIRDGNTGFTSESWLLASRGAVGIATNQLRCLLGSVHEALEMMPVVAGEGEFFTAVHDDDVLSGVPGTQFLHLGDIHNG
jgi:hypothetical protein